VRALLILSLGLGMLGCGAVLTGIPDLDTPDGQVFAKYCASCHGKFPVSHGVPDPRFRTLQEWEEQILPKMDRLARDKGHPPSAARCGSRCRPSLSPASREIIRSYSSDILAVTAAVKVEARSFRAMLFCHICCSRWSTSVVCYARPCYLTAHEESSSNDIFFIKGGVP